MITYDVLLKLLPTEPHTRVTKTKMNTRFWPAVFAASAFAAAVLAGSLNGIGDWHEGEIGNTLGAVTADALGSLGDSERLYFMSHDPAAMRDTGAPATFAAPVAPRAGYSA